MLLDLLHQLACRKIQQTSHQLDFYLLSEVSNFPVVLTDQNSSQLVFTPEPNSVNASVKPDSIKLVTNKKQSPEGIVYQISVKMQFLTRSESLEQLLDQYQNKPGICHVKFNNEFQKILGTNETPLYMIYEVEDGDKVDSDNGTTLEIKGETRHRPVYYIV